MPIFWLLRVWLSRFFPQSNVLQRWVEIWHEVEGQFLHAIFPAIGAGVDYKFLEIWECACTTIYQIIRCLWAVPWSINLSNLAGFTRWIPKLWGNFGVHFHGTSAARSSETTRRIRKRFRGRLVRYALDYICTCGEIIIIPNVPENIFPLFWQVLLLDFNSINYCAMYNGSAVNLLCVLYWDRI